MIRVLDTLEHLVIDSTAVPFERWNTTGEASRSACSRRYCAFDHDLQQSLALLSTVVSEGARRLQT